MLNLLNKCFFLIHEDLISVGFSLAVPIWVGCILSINLISVGYSLGIGLDEVCFYLLLRINSSYLVLSFIGTCYWWSDLLRFGLVSLPFLGCEILFLAVIMVLYFTYCRWNLSYLCAGI